MNIPPNMSENPDYLPELLNKHSKVTPRKTRRRKYFQTMADEDAVFDLKVAFFFFKFSCGLSNYHACITGLI
jgi:hypothetical protein